MRKIYQSNILRDYFGIESIIVYDKPQYHSIGYVGTYLITYTDDIYSWGDDKEWLDKTLNSYERIKKELELNETISTY